MNKENHPHTSIKYRSDIDGLRAMAILAVVIFHAFPTKLTGGFVGVDIFFVISGYLITSIILKKINEGNFSFIDFYVRRIKRIFPALLTVIAVSYLFGWHALFMDEFKALGKHILGGIAFVQNFVLYSEAGYFDTVSEVKPLMHLWSLSIEEQFYLIFPIIMIIGWKLRFNILTVIILLIGISFSLNISEVHSNPTAAFFMPYTRFWELMAGSLLAYLLMFKKDSSYSFLESVIFKKSKNYSSDMPLKHLLSLVGFALIISSFFIIDKSSLFPGWLAVITVSGSFLMIMAGPYAFFNKYILSNKLMVWIGLISYPLYLWHWPILSFARIIESEIPSREIRILAVVASFALSWLTYVLIEKPLRFGKHSGIKAIVLLLLSIAMGIVGFYTYSHNGIESRSVIEKNKEVSNQFVSSKWAYADNDICLNTYKSDFNKRYGWWFCIQEKDENPTLLLLGNSYANHLYPGMIHNKQLSSQNILSIGTCDPGTVTSIDNEIKGEDGIKMPCSGNHIYESQEFINNIISKTPSIKHVIINGLNLDESRHKWYIDRIKKRIDFLESKGISVIVFVPHIKQPIDIKLCFPRPFKRSSFDCDLSIEEKNKQKQEFTHLMNEIHRSNPNVKFFDQNDAFCNDKKCSFIVDGLPAFRDQYSHYSEYMSDKVADYFLRWAKENSNSVLDK